GAVPHAGNAHVHGRRHRVHDPARHDHAPGGHLPRVHHHGGDRGPADLLRDHDAGVRRAEPVAVPDPAGRRVQAEQRPGGPGLAAGRRRAATKPVHADLRLVHRRRAHRLAALERVRARARVPGEVDALGRPAHPGHPELLRIRPLRERAGPRAARRHGAGGKAHGAGRGVDSARARQALTGTGGVGRRYTGALMVLAAASLWGTLGYFGRRLYPLGITPLELASVRATIGLLGLALWAARTPARLRIRPRDLPFFALYGAIAVALFQWLYFATIQRTTLANAAALLYTAPAFVVLLARAAGDQRVTRPQLAALAMVLAGVFLVTGAAASLAGGSSRISAAALALGLGSGLTYGLYTVFGKRALARYDAVQTVFWAFAFGALALSLAAPPWRPFIAHPGAASLLVALGLLPTLAA